MMNVATPFPSPSHPQPDPSTGGRLVSTTGRALPLEGTVIAAEAEGGIARVRVEQVFQNPHAEPLAVTYSLPLPAEGAVSGFAFTVDGRRVVGEIDARKAARERYEEALMEGRSAALLEQDRSSLFTQEIGNIPPGGEVVVEVIVDQRLRWLDEGAWEWRFPTVVAPRYLGEAGRVPDADRVSQDVADGPLDARFHFACAVRDRLSPGRWPESPSHSITVEDRREALSVSLSRSSGARLDRDLVVRWPVAKPAASASLATCRPRENKPIARSAYGLLTVAPPLSAGARTRVWRDLIVLIDTSGSMSGEPLAQAARVVSAIIDTMDEDDSIELIEFGSAPRRWKSQPVSATRAARREAISWVKALRASGATEMRTAIIEALSGVRQGAQRQVVLVTDGQIGFESQVVEQIMNRLPQGSRLHTVGVGSAVNRSLTGPAARAGHGVEVVIGLGEDPERAAARIVARTNAPILVDLAVSGSALVEHAPYRLPDLFAGSPALLSVALRPEGGNLVLRGRTFEGEWEQRIAVPPIEAGEGSEAIAALFAREKVEDLELRLAAGSSAREIDPAVEEIGIAFQISTRLTSWIAVSADRTVDPGDPLRRERMPHELPFGMSAEGLGLRPAVAAAPVLRAQSVRRMPAAPAKMMKKEIAGGGGPSGNIPPPPFARPAAPPPPPPAAPRSGARPATPPPAPQRARTLVADQSLLDKIKDRLVGTAEKDAREEAKAEAPAAKKPKRDAGPRLLRGKVTLHRAGLLVIEIAVDGAPLDWQPPAAARVTFADHRAFTATLDAGRSTRAGAVAGGAVVRLAITLPAGAPVDGVLRVTLELDGEAVLIEV